LELGLRFSRRLTGEQSSLLARIAAAESISVRADEKLTAFGELESQLAVKRDGFLGKGVFRVCDRM